MTKFLNNLENPYFECILCFKKIWGQIKKNIQLSHFLVPIAKCPRVNNQENLPSSS